MFLKLKKDDTKNHEKTKKHEKGGVLVSKDPTITIRKAVNYCQYCKMRKFRTKQGRYQNYKS